jgi:hypothetical protein
MPDTTHENTLLFKQLFFLLNKNTSWLNTTTKLNISMVFSSSQIWHSSEACSDIGSSSYALAGFLHKRLSPHAKNLESFVKKTGHFEELLKFVNLQSLDTLDCVSLFTTVPVNGALQVIINNIHSDDTLAEWLKPSWNCWRLLRLLTMVYTTQNPWVFNFVLHLVF